MWDLERGQSVHTLAGQTDSVTAVALMPDGRRVALVSDYHVLRVWDLESGQLLRALEGHTDWVTAVAVTPDGRRAISASADHTLRVWDLESGQLGAYARRPYGLGQCRGGNTGRAPRHLGLG